MSKQNKDYLTQFKIQNDKPDFPKMEEEILSFWNEIDALEM